MKHLLYLSLALLMVSCGSPMPTYEEIMCENDALNEEIEELENQIIELENELSEKDDEIERLQDIIENAQSEMTDIRNQMFIDSHDEFMMDWEISDVENVLDEY